MSGFSGLVFDEWSMNVVGAVLPIAQNFVHKPRSRYLNTIPIDRRPCDYTDVWIIRTFFGHRPKFNCTIDIACTLVETKFVEYILLISYGQSYNSVLSNILKEITKNCAEPNGLHVLRVQWKCQVNHIRKHRVTSVNYIRVQYIYIHSVVNRNRLGLLKFFASLE